MHAECKWNENSIRFFFFYLSFVALFYRNFRLVHISSNVVRFSVGVYSRRMYLFSKIEPRLIEFEDFRQIVKKMLCMSVPLCMCEVRGQKCCRMSYLLWKKDFASACFLLLLFVAHFSLHCATRKSNSCHNLWDKREHIYSDINSLVKATTAHTVQCGFGIITQHNNFEGNPSICLSFDVYNSVCTVILCKNDWLLSRKKVIFVCVIFFILFSFRCFCFALNL